MRDDKYSELYESQVESLYVATEKPEPSVRELAKIAPQDNLQESIVCPHSKVESEIAESRHQTETQPHDSDRYLSSDRSLSQKPSYNPTQSYKPIHSIHSDDEIPRDAQKSQVSILGTGLSLTQEWTSLREDSERYDSQVESLQVVTEKKE
jgi:hypothetical protein